METIDNVNKTLKEDLETEIHKGSKISIAAACFSIYAFAELKKELKNVDELRFIFTSPTFIKEKAKREKREFYIPRQEREKNLFGSEFEVKLRNEMTQKAIAKECADWIRKKAVFKSNVTNEIMMGFINVDDKSYMTLNGFTTVDLGCERGNNAYYIINKLDAPVSNTYLQLFEQIWNDASKLQEVTDEVIENITTVYNENSPDYLYFVTLFNIFNEFLEDVSEDVLPNEATGFKEIFSYPKPIGFLKKLIKYATDDEDIIIDFFSGSATTAQAVIEINKEEKTDRKFIMVQIPEILEEGSAAYRKGFKTLCDIGCARINKIIDESCSKEGYRYLKLDSSNMKDIYYTPSETQQSLFDTYADNIKEDRTPEDLLFQVMLDLGVLLSSKIEETTIAGKQVFNVADGFLIACFDKDVTEETVKAVAEKKPYYAVFRDSSMANDSVATNFDQIFASISPETVRKVL